MRISTSTLYDSNAVALTQLQSKLLHTQQQISSGRRILSPADDPANAARALEITQSDATNTQYATNRNEAIRSLSLSEEVLKSVTTLLQGVKTAAVSAGSGVASASDKRSLAADLRGRMDELLGLANSTDGIGNYLFSGFQGKTLPFASGASGVQYMADDGQRLIQAGSARQMVASDSGADIFMRIKNGNGTFIAAPVSGPVTLSTGAAIAPDGVTVTIVAPASTSTLVVGATLTGGGFPVGTTVQSIVNATTFVASQAGTPIASPPGTTLQVGAGNTGSGIVSQGVVTNQAAMTGHNYQITFGVVTGTTTYSVTDTTTGATLSAGNPYVSGQAINFDGMQLEITGVPANGDAFKTNPSTNESLFKTIADMISALESGGSSARFTNSLNKVLNSLDRGLENVLTVRSSLGARLQELDVMQSAGEDIGLQFKQSISQLQDVDYNKAVTDLAQQQSNLEAAQKSFQFVSGLTLFNYM